MRTDDLGKPFYKVYVENLLSRCDELIADQDAYAYIQIAVSIRLANARHVYDYELIHGTKYQDGVKNTRTAVGGRNAIVRPFPEVQAEIRRFRELKQFLAVREDSQRDFELREAGKAKALNTVHCAWVTCAYQKSFDQPTHCTQMIFLGFDSDANATFFKLSGKVRCVGAHDRPPTGIFHEWTARSPSPSDRER